MDNFEGLLKYHGMVYSYIGRDVAHNLLMLCPIYRFFHDSIVKPLKNADEKIANQSDTMKQAIENEKRAERKYKEKLTLKDALIELLMSDKLEELKNKKDKNVKLGQNMNDNCKGL